MAGTRVGAVVNRILFVAVPRLAPVKPALVSVPSERLANVRLTVPEPAWLELKIPPERPKVSAEVFVSAELAELPA